MSRLGAVQGFVHGAPVLGIVNSEGRVVTDQKHRNREKRIWRNRKNRDAADLEIDRLLEQYERSNELIRNDLQQATA